MALVLSTPKVELAKQFGTSSTVGQRKEKKEKKRNCASLSVTLTFSPFFSAVIVHRRVRAWPRPSVQRPSGPQHFHGPTEVVFHALHGLDRSGWWGMGHENLSERHFYWVAKKVAPAAWIRRRRQSRTHCSECMSTTWPRCCLFIPTQLTAARTCALLLETLEAFFSLPSPWCTSRPHSARASCRTSRRRTWSSGGLRVTYELRTLYMKWAHRTRKVCQKERKTRSSYKLGTLFSAHMLPIQGALLTKKSLIPLFKTLCSANASSQVPPFRRGDFSGFSKCQASIWSFGWWATRYYQIVSYCQYAIKEVLSWLLTEALAFSTGSKNVQSSS